MLNSQTGLDETPTVVTVKVYVNGELCDEHTNSDVPAYAVNYVVGATLTQVEDPDLEAARDCHDFLEADGSVASGT